MLSKQYFLIKPTEFGHNRFRELGVGNEEDVTNPRVWAQDFDLRVSVVQEQRNWCTKVVLLQFIAFLLTELEDMDVTAFSELSFDELSKFYSVEWVDGGLLEFNAIESDFSPSVAERLRQETHNTSPELANELRRDVMK